MSAACAATDSAAPTIRINERGFIASVVEDDHVARDPARLERGEAFVDLLELDPRRHHLLQVQAALQVELDQARHVGAEAVRSHHAALDAALAQEVDAV